jgi:hypothetical protein
MGRFSTAQVSPNITDPSEIEKKEENDESLFSFSILLILGLLLVT